MDDDGDTDGDRWLTDVEYDDREEEGCFVDVGYVSSGGSCEASMKVHWWKMELMIGCLSSSSATGLEVGKPVQVVVRRGASCNRTEALSVLVEVVWTGARWRYVSS